MYFIDYSMQLLILSYWVFKVIHKALANVTLLSQ